MMYSAYKLNKQGDSIQPWRTPFRIWNQSVVPYDLAYGLRGFSVSRMIRDEMMYLNVNEMKEWGVLITWKRYATAAVAKTLRWRHVCCVQEEQQGPCNSTSGHLYGEKLDLKRNMHPIFHSSTVSIAKTWKQTKCPLTGEQKCHLSHQKDVVYIHNAVLFSL